MILRWETLRNPCPPNQKGKRNPSPLPTPPGFHIPKRTNLDNQRQRGRSAFRASRSSTSREENRRSQQSNQAPRSSQANFGKTRPPINKPTCYRNQGRQQHHKEGQDTYHRASPHRSASPTREQLERDRDQLRQQLRDMGRRLDQMENW